MSMHMALPPPPTVRLKIRHRAAGLLGFVLALVLLRFPIGRAVVVVTRVKNCVASPASPDEALTAVVAARNAARWFPGRAACLENSLAATFTSSAASPSRLVYRGATHALRRARLG